MSIPPISVTGLTKRYGPLQAVKGVDLEVAEGEVFGLLGPNGAGKTTIVEILEGLRLRTSGEISVLGFDPGKHSREVRNHIGVCLQDTNLADRAKVSEVVRLYASCYRKHADITALLKRMALWDKRDAYCASLSGGQRQRLALVLALINDPQLVFLDEPAAGLDPHARRDIHEVLRELRADGRTVVLTTHQIGEAEQVCDRIGILNQGRLIATGKPSELRLRSTPFPSVIVVKCNPKPYPADLAFWPDARMDEAREEGAVLRISSNNVAETMGDLVKWAEQKHYVLNDLEVRQHSLEDVFLELTAAGGVS